MTDIHTIPAIQSDADRALEQKHRPLWASVDYPRLASELIWRLGPRLVAAAAVQPGERVLDIAAGSGNVAIPAALHGATVVASDLTPELFDVGRRLATEAGAELEWREADAEALPFADGSFDVRALVRGRDVRTPPPAGRRRTRARHRPRRTHRPHQLDPRRIHRPHVRDNEAVRRAASRGRAARAALGRRAARARACSAIGSTTSRPCGRPSRSMPSHAASRSATTSRPTTGRRSRCTTASPTTPTGPRARRGARRPRVEARARRHRWRDGVGVPPRSPRACV